MKIQIPVLGMKLDFQANRIPPLLSKQICRGLLAGPEEEREREERERHCSLVHKAFKRWLWETHVVWNSSLLREESEELFQTFCDQLSLLVKQFQRKVVMREHRIFACHALTFFSPPYIPLSLTEVNCCVVGRRKYHIPQLSQVLPLPACVQRTFLPDVLLPTTYPMSAWVPLPGTPPKLQQ